jgi:hypothetical protein
VVSRPAVRDQTYVDRSVAESARVEAQVARAWAAQLCDMSASLVVEAALVQAVTQRSVAECKRAVALGARSRALRAENRLLRTQIDHEVARSRTRTGEVREAHFGVLRLLIDGTEWPCRGATLDVYHRGPDYDDVGAARWEVHFNPLPPYPMALTLYSPYLVEVEIRDGRELRGKAVLQHNAGARWSLLDADRPLAELRSSDLT